MTLGFLFRRARRRYRYDNATALSIAKGALYYHERSCKACLLDEPCDIRPALQRRVQRARFRATETRSQAG